MTGKLVTSGKILNTPYESYGFESGDILPFTTSGDAVWSVVSGESNTGTFSVKAGVINDAQESVLSLNTTTVGKLNVVSFSYKAQPIAGICI